MTFTPSVLSTIDTNNTTILFNGGSYYNGTSTDTTGYNMITLNVLSNTTSSAPGGLVVNFSPDNVAWTPYSSDTVYGNLPFIKNYPVISQYYYVNYTSTNNVQTSIQSHLSTIDFSTSSNSMSVFDNDTEASLDAFGKLRVSFPETLLDLRFPGQSTGTTQFLLNKDQIYINSSGTYNVTAQNSKCVMEITGNSTCISQSRKYCTYQPGKSLLFLASGVIHNGGVNPNEEGYISRIGYYDDRNGLYFEYDSSANNNNGGMSICLKNSVLTSFPQSSWNIDKMDGTGPSKLNLNFLKTQLYVIDMEWLGVGRVRYGFYAFGKIHYCHQILNLNTLIEPYTNGINLPIRYEIFGYQNNPSSASITQICSTVISEGGYNPIGRPFSISTGLTSISVLGTNSGSPETAILALRGGGSNYYHQTILPTSFLLFLTDSNTIVLYRLWLFHDSIPFTVTWTNASTTSVTQYAFNPNITNFSTSGGILCDSGYFSGRNSFAVNTLGDVFNTIFQITSNSQNFSDVVLLTAQIVNGNNTNTYASTNWQEIY